MVRYLKDDLLNITDFEGGWMGGIVGTQFFHFYLLVFAMIIIVVHPVLYLMHIRYAVGVSEMVFNTLYFNYSVISSFQIH